jgi:hypothetical protein
MYSLVERGYQYLGINTLQVWPIRIRPHDSSEQTTVRLSLSPFLFSTLNVHTNKALHRCVVERTTSYGNLLEVQLVVYTQHRRFDTTTSPLKASAASGGATCRVLAEGYQACRPKRAGLGKMTLISGFTQVHVGCICPMGLVKALRSASSIILSQVRITSGLHRTRKTMAHEHGRGSPMVCFPLCSASERTSKMPMIMPHG